MPNPFLKGKSKIASLLKVFLTALNLSPKDGRMAKWQRRHQHLHTKVSHYPRRLRQDALDLAKVFMGRKALKLRLCNSYLMKVWGCSERTVSRRLQALESLGFLKRLTFPPRQKSGGGWEQLRYLFLIVGKVKSKLAGQGGLLFNRLLPQSSEPEPPGKSRNTPFSFEDYLAQRQDVPLNSFLFWMRRWGAEPRTMGYIRAVWKKISRRADILESILWCANDENLKGKRRVGFIVSEIRARV